MKKTEKYLSVMERRAAATARMMEAEMDVKHFTMRYQMLYVLSPLPWCALSLAIGVVGVIVSAWWLALLGFFLGAAFGCLMLDWALWRAEVTEEKIILSRLGIIKRTYERSALDRARLMSGKNSEEKRLLLTFGTKTFTFVGEMIGFELLTKWAK